MQGGTRLGGDEFVVLTLESPDIDTAASVARLEERLDQFNRSAQRPFRLAASMGVAQHGPESAESLTELLGRADAGMYQGQATAPRRMLVLRTRRCRAG